MNESKLNDTAKTDSIKKFLNMLSQALKAWGGCEGEEESIHEGGEQIGADKETRTSPF